LAGKELTSPLFTDTQMSSAMELDEPDGSGAKANCQQSSEESDDDGTYCFESDHLALKGNKDYQKLLKALVMLEAQKKQAIKDLDTLMECQKVALRDPIKFVQNLQGGVSLNFPQPLKIAKMPEIDWDNYISGSEQFNLDLPKHMTRGKKGGCDTASVVSGKLYNYKPEIKWSGTDNDLSNRLVHV
jgi:hypothetical protein